jgi:2'-5' RNA ligase
MQFLTHNGDGPMSTALAMNIHYEPVKDLRKPIEECIGRPLNFLTSWNKDGEAHVTTITPVEFDKYLKGNITPEEMEVIARNLKIEESDIEIKGIGSGCVKIEGKEEETFFVIIDSNNLRNIRKTCYELYCERVKAKNQEPEWNYKEFFPHITIGYTKRDLHIQDGVIKDVEHSLDERFPFYLIQTT